ncbi:MAG: deoxynucleoside kinase, partial [Myxococcota bacterium]|nr:deoxynucleoside kinase [Myxococcota bacterium]
RMDVLLERIKRRGRPFEENFDEDYLRALSEAYQHYFSHYEGQSPLLDLDTSDLNYVDSDDVLEDLYARICNLASDVPVENSNLARNRLHASRQA